MYPETNIKQQQGFGLPVAIFVLVIMALLAAAIVQLSSRSNIASTQEELSNRAFYAAESGASWAMSRLFFSTGSPADRAYSDAQCAALGGPPVLNGAAGLRDCTVAVSCAAAASASGAASLYTINSVGTCAGGTAAEAVRTVQVGAKNGS